MPAYTCPLCHSHPTSSPENWCQSCLVDELSLKIGRKELGELLLEIRRKEKEELEARQKAEMPVYTCPRCHSYSTSSPENRCQSCLDELLLEIGRREKVEEEFEARQKKILEIGVFFFIFYGVIIALILLIVGSIIGYFRLGGFSSRLFQAIGLWIMSAVLYLISIPIMITFDGDEVKHWIQKNITSGFTYNFDEILEDVLALYDLEQMTWSFDDSITIVFWIIILFMLLIGAAGLSLDIGFLVTGDLMEALQEKWAFAGIIILTFTMPYMKSFCQWIGESMDAMMPLPIKYQYPAARN